MKKSVAFILSVAILISGLFCIYINAETEAPTVKVSGHNLALQSNICVVYYVKADNVPAGAESGLLIWSSAQTEYTYANATYRLTEHGTQTIGGVVYDAYEFKDVAARQMTDDFYAKAYIKSGDEIIYSNLDKYSILKYAYSKKSSTNTNLKNLVNSVLEYGAMAQIYFGYKTDRLANAEYSQITVTNGTLPDGTTSGLYKVGDVIKLSASMPDGETFDHWENAAGELVGIKETLTVAVTESAQTYTASSAAADTSNLVQFDCADNGDGTTTAKISVSGDVDMYGFEFKLKFTLNGLEYASNSVLASGAAANYMNDEYIIFSYTSPTGADISAQTELLSLTFNNTADVRSAVITVYDIDMFDESYNDSSYSVIHNVYTNQ
ncbi:MAG: hypothetical protein IJY27_07560 [Clostridia bacterium]|nr:hypothetical protein [Clostridia bacterium]